MLFPWEVRWNPLGNHQENSYRTERKEIRKGLNTAEDLTGKKREMQSLRDKKAAGHIEAKGHRDRSQSLLISSYFICK